MSDYEFKARVPVDCVRHIISIVREGALTTKSGELLQHVGAATGEIGALLATWQEPKPFGALLAEAPARDLESVVAEVEDALSSIDNGPVGFNPAIWIPLIIQLIKAILATQ